MLCEVVVYNFMFIDSNKILLLHASKLRDGSGKAYTCVYCVCLCVCVCVCVCVCGVCVWNPT